MTTQQERIQEKVGRLIGSAHMMLQAHPDKRRGSISDLITECELGSQVRKAMVTAGVIDDGRGTAVQWTWPGPPDADATKNVVAHYRHLCKRDADAARQRRQARQEAAQGSAEPGPGVQLSLLTADEQDEFRVITDEAAQLKSDAADLREMNADHATRINSLELRFQEFLNRVEARQAAEQDQGVSH